MKTDIKNPKIVTIAGGFYFFGDLIESDEGWITLKNYAMFGGFEGGKGLPGVARGDSSAKVTLDRFAEDEFGHFPVESCYGIHPSINLYTFKNTTLR